MRMTSRTTGLMTITMNRMEHKALRVIISGGGTGGHIFPAVSIANKLKEQNPKTEILFVGAEGKMEMEKVPCTRLPSFLLVSPANPFCSWISAGMCIPVAAQSRGALA